MYAHLYLRMKYKLHMCRYVLYMCTHTYPRIKQVYNNACILINTYKHTNNYMHLFLSLYAHFHLHTSTYTQPYECTKSALFVHRHIHNERYALHVCTHIFVRTSNVHYTCLQICTTRVHTSSYAHIFPCLDGNRHVDINKHT